MLSTVLLPRAELYRPQLALAHTETTVYDLDTDADVSLLVTRLGGSATLRAAPSSSSSSSSTPPAATGTAVPPTGAPTATTGVVVTPGGTPAAPTGAPTAATGVVVTAAGTAAPGAGAPAAGAGARVGGAGAPAATAAARVTPRRGRRQRRMNEPAIVNSAYHRLWAAGFTRESARNRTTGVFEFIGSTWWRPLAATDTSFGAGTPMHMTVVADGVLMGSRGESFTISAYDVRSTVSADWHVTAEGPTSRDNRHQHYIQDRANTARRNNLGENAAAKAEALGYINAIR